MCYTPKKSHLGGAEGTEEAGNIGVTLVVTDRP